MMNEDNHNSAVEPQNIDKSPIRLLKNIRDNGRVWADLCRQYGVDNPEPPWKVSLEGMCDALNEGSCALPALERRLEEDALVESVYLDMPSPEGQLLALVHSMIKRNLLDESELEKRIKQVSKRLNMT